jgi:DedD protein
MEESLKARLIGAAVLVALAVLLIPELLTGRKEAPVAADATAGPRGTRSFTIELGPQPGQAARSPMTSSAPPPAATSAVAAAQGVAQPGPAPTDDAPVAPDAGEPASEPDDAPPQVQAQPASAPAAAGSRVQAAPPAGEPARSIVPPAGAVVTGGWAVQVGAFGSADTARKLARDLSAAGYRAFVSPTQRAGKTLYRVRVGPEGERTGAEQLVPRLKARGLPATIVQND